MTGLSSYVQILAPLPSVLRLEHFDKSFSKESTYLRLHFINKIDTGGYRHQSVTRQTLPPQSRNSETFRSRTRSLHSQASIMLCSMSEITIFHVIRWSMSEITILHVIRYSISERHLLVTENSLK